MTGVVRKRRSRRPRPPARTESASAAWVPDTMERRSQGLLRIPFVRKCALDFGDGRLGTAFLVNINVLGAYIARDEIPTLGQNVACRFGVPGNDRELALLGVVAWLNPRQQHPVHSLPPGFGLKFRELSEKDRHRIEQVIADYVTQHPQGR